MKNFLEDLFRIMQIISLKGEDYVEEDIGNHMKAEYELLSETERKQIMDVIYDLAENDEKMYLYILSIVVNFVKDITILEEISNKLLCHDFQLIYSINMLNRINKFIFTRNKNYDSLFEVRKNIYKKNINTIRKEIKVRKYIPYCRREKRVVLIINPLLGLLHAPSKKLDYIAFFLDKLGYEVMTVSLNNMYIEIAHCCDWFRSSEHLSNTLSEFTIEFDQKFHLARLKGYYVMFDDDNYLEMTNAILDRIYEYTPEFVMMIGDCCPVADLCSDFTSVAVIGCTKKNPITTAPIIARCSIYSEKEEELYRSHLDKGQVIVDYKEQNIVTESEENYTKEQFGNDSSDFLVCIVGNRLDIEISMEFIEILNGILKENGEVKIVFIGNCPELEEILKKSSYRQRFQFWGYQNHLKAAIGVCDLFLNPPRQGGGIGALYACEKQVPVITLPDCDCSNVGDAFICNSIDEMPELVNKYIHDKEFMNNQKAQCRIKAQEFQNRDGMQEIKKMCDFIKRYTLQTECMDE